MQIHLKETFKDGAKWAKENPGVMASGLVGIAGAAVVAGPALVTAPLLLAGGFSSTGVVAGSVAAGVQAGIGNVVAHSTFAYLTSAAMGGYGAPVVAAVAQGGGAIAAVAGTAGAVKTAGKDETGKDKKD